MSTRRRTRSPATTTSTASSPSRAQARRSQAVLSRSSSLWRADRDYSPRMAEERRLVTVLFADVVESTELGEALDPEDLRALLGAYYALAKGVIANHGGTAEK